MQNVQRTLKTSPKDNKRPDGKMGRRPYPPPRGGCADGKQAHGKVPDATGRQGAAKQSNARLSHPHEHGPNPDPDGTGAGAKPGTQTAQPLSRTVWRLLSKLSVCSACDPATTLLGIYPEQMETSTQNLQMFTAAVRSHTWSDPAVLQCVMPSTLCFIQTMGYDSALRDEPSGHGQPGGASTQRGERALPAT